MANDYFRFQHFTIYQSLCAMKVGTDGMLLGAWARLNNTNKIDSAEGNHCHCCNILDIGTGTGLIAMMLAQRYPSSKIMAIDIDSDAITQATSNIENSPFSQQITTENISIQDFAHINDNYSKYNLIVCNPPFFLDSLTCPNNKRTIARHTTTLKFIELTKAAINLLSDDGIFSVILPKESLQQMHSDAALTGLFQVCECAVITSERKPAKRFLVSYAKKPQQLRCSQLQIWSDEYKTMLSDFLLPQK